jgi:hypothetical protein
VPCSDTPASCGDCIRVTNVLNRSALPRADTLRGFFVFVVRPARGASRTEAYKERIP